MLSKSASKQLKLVTAEIRALPAWVQNILPKTVRREAGSILIEYALVASLLGAGAIVALQNVGLNVADILNTLAGEM